MKTATETYHYRVQRWSIPVKAPWMPQKWTISQSSLRNQPPSPGRGVPGNAKVTKTSKRTTWEWVDGYGMPQRVVAIKLARPVTETYEYINV